MTTLERHECLASLIAEWERMPDGEPARRERWFIEVAALIAGMPHGPSREQWVKAVGGAIHTKHDGLPLSICMHIVQLRVEAAQKGGAMYRENVRKPLAASGTADEFFGKESVSLNEFIPEDYRRYDRMVMMGAVMLGLLILCLAFWPVILDWMTPFKYGVVAGALGMAALLIGCVAVGVCLGAGNLEKRK
jgi:hypothetical protein